MSTQTVGDFIVERLHQWGIQRVYGYSGDGINGVMSALRRAEDKITLVQPRHEELAAFMASGHAKYTGETGVVVATSGPGAVHALNGLYDAAKDHMPVVAILGQQARVSLGSDFQQEANLESLCQDVAGYVQTLMAPEQTRHVVDRALRIAEAERTVTCVIVPNDLQDAAMAQPPAGHGSTWSGTGYRASERLPKSADLDAAARLLDQGDKVAILAGAGVQDAVPQLLELADALGAGVAKAVLAKTMIADDAPGVTGGIGLLGTEPSDYMMRHCDTLLMVGTSFPYAEFLPACDQAKGVQIDVDAANLGLRFPNEVNLHGHARPTLQALLERVTRKPERSWRETLEGRVRDWWETLEARANTSAEPLNPQKLFWELSPRLPEGVRLAADVGTATDWYSRFLKVGGHAIGSTSGGHASMGNGIPYALAAKFAAPDKPVIALVGDGAMQMIGNNGLITVAHYWRQWSNPTLIVLVLNNGDLNQVTWEQRVMEGDPKFETSQALPDFDYDRYAEMLGLRGLRVDHPDQVGPVWDQALAADRPVVINAVVDPNVPPLPTHLELDQVKGYLGSILKGDPEAGAEIRQSLKAMAAKYLKR
ncbi:thiamine pyrophosphate-requiring protein [Alcanivorax sp. N3-2A]|nr:thiamine pyrophosphate-requiring protein [Alcanivorax sp. N3-2A]|tara:strand:+ start:20943 stop:22724 length:1782 start_codon:yes stop_codon:yes gene_type:complete